MIQYGSYIYSLINRKEGIYRTICRRFEKECENTKIELKEQHKTRTKCNSSLKASIQFTKPMQIK